MNTLPTTIRAAKPGRAGHAMITALMAVAATLAVLLGTSAPAMADSGNGASGDVGTLADHSMYTSDQSWPYDPAGRMWFNEYGDVVTLCDNDADGQRVYLTVTKYSGASYGMSVGGEGNCVKRKASMGSKYNLPEGKYVTFEISASGDPVASYTHASWLNDH